MRVIDWMGPDPVTVTAMTTVREARRLLAYYGIRHLPVVEGERVVGMVSDRDVRIDDLRLSGAPDSVAVDRILGSGEVIRSIMSSPAHTIGPDDSVEAAARAMLSRRISALPVVDASRHLVGVITTTDCLLAALTPSRVG